MMLFAVVKWMNPMLCSECRSFMSSRQKLEADLKRLEQSWNPRRSEWLQTMYFDQHFILRSRVNCAKRIEHWSSPLFGHRLSNLFVKCLC
jgi:hypothetical protein